MLKDNFFTITSLQHEGNSIKVTLEINSAHKIFGGHFPGQPVVPGACILQMLKEILEQDFNEKLRLIKAHYLKFLSIINPEENNVCDIEIQYKKEANGIITVSAQLLQQTKVCFKFSGIFMMVS